MTTARSALRWWGAYDLPVGQAGLWRIGPLSLWIQHLSGEWRAHHDVGDDPLDPCLAVTVPSEPRDLSALETVYRFALGDRGSQLEISAALPDRPIVTRPETPFHLPPGESATVYVGTPLWVRISVGAGPTLLTELPAYRPSDTWFGPPTDEGELCYATRTVCRLELSELPMRPHRAVTAVRLVNRAKTALGLVRLKLPVPRLELYEGAGGRLWTQDIAFERREGHEEFAALRLLPGPPGADPAARLLTPARDPGSDNDLFRAFSVLFARRSGDSA